LQKETQKLFETGAGRAEPALQRRRARFKKVFAGFFQKALLQALPGLFFS
jgi:hypothetical protein